jgi:hypothetical protein
MEAVKMEGVQTENVKFNDNLTWRAAYGLTSPFDDCSWYTFPGGVSTIHMIFLVIFLIIALITSVILIISGQKIFGSVLLVIALLSTALPVFTNAYLKKGCEASKMLKKIQSLKSPQSI